MIIDIDKVIVEDRIRKDFGNIQELAEDIKENGLINPPVINKEYRLLAGERRLRACKELGWKQIEVRMMDTKDAEHELNIEISENENRKEFSKAERADYMKRLLRIEQAKAKERQGERTSVEKQTEVIRADEETAKQFGIGKDTLRKELSISENRDLLTPEDFADWDEGRLSTNKAYQAIKQALAEKEERIAKLEQDANKPTMRDKFYQERIETLNSTNEKLKARIVELERSEYQLKTSVPEDYEETRKRLSETEEELADAKEKLSESNAEIKDLEKKLLGAKKKNGSLPVSMFVEQCRVFLKSATSQGKSLMKGKNADDWSEWHDCVEVLAELAEWAQSFSSELSSAQQNAKTQ